MKFSTKLFLCTMLILTAALSFAEYYTVSSSLDNAVNHQVESGLQQHQLVQYALQSGILNAARNASPGSDTLGDIAAQTADAMSVSLDLAQAEGDGLYSNMPQGLSGTLGEDGTIQYSIVRRASDASGVLSNWLVMTSAFSQSGFSLELTTARNVSDVFSEAEQLQNSCQRVFFFTAIAGSLVTLILSRLLTRPIQRLERASAAFARGDYARRLDSRSGDEIGDLTRTYNRMADTIEDKIGELELAVRQREDFVANFAHEIKTPMTSIIGYADTLYQKTMTPEQVHEAAGYIVNEGMRLEALSFKLLELVTLDRQDFLLEEMDVRQMLRDVEETVFPAALKRKVAVRFSAQPGYVRVEYDLFKTLLLNLLDNALKSGASLVQVTGEARGDRYTIEIRDNGRGIPEDQLQRITEAFYMVDKSRSRKEHGAGLGLALAAKIAAIHATRLRYDSVEGEGTTVSLVLPAGEQEELA